MTNENSTFICNKHFYVLCVPQAVQPHSLLINLYLYISDLLLVLTNGRKEWRLWANKKIK